MLMVLRWIRSPCIFCHQSQTPKLSPRFAHLINKGEDRRRRWWNGNSNNSKIRRGRNLRGWLIGHNFRLQFLPGRHRSSCRFFGLSFGGWFPRGWVGGRRRRHRLSFFHRFGRRRRFILLFNSRNLVVLAGLPRHRCRHFSHLYLGDKKIYLTSPSKQKNSSSSSG